MKPTKLIHYNDTKKDLLFWIKRFLADKIATVSRKKVKDDFDLAALVRDMTSDATDTIEKVIEVAATARRMGLDGIKRPSSNVEKLYRFVEANTDTLPSITSINKATIDTFAEKSEPDASDEAKDTMFNVSRNLFNFIDDNTPEGEHLFGIKKGKKGWGGRAASGAARKTQPTHLTEEEIRQYNKGILGIDYASEFERNRDILIGRILLFSGITASELIELRDEDIVEDEVDPVNILQINIDGKGAAKRSIPVPKRKLVVFLNAYKESRGVSKNGRMFFSPATAKKSVESAMTDKGIRGILARQFKAVGLPEKKATPTVMRNSFGIFMYRSMMFDGNPNADRYVQKLMGHSNVVTTRNLVKFSGVNQMKVAKFFESLTDK